MAEAKNSAKTLQIIDISSTYAIIFYIRGHGGYHCTSLVPFKIKW